MTEEIRTDNTETLKNALKRIEELEKENEELRRIAEHQQSSNMNTHFENKKLKEGLEVGSILNRGLIASNKYLEEERDKYRNMVFDLLEENEEAKKIIKEFSDRVYYEGLSERAEEFIKE